MTFAAFRLGDDLFLNNQLHNFIYIIDNDIHM